MNAHARSLLVGILGEEAVQAIEQTENKLGDSYADFRFAVDCLIEHRVNFSEEAAMNRLEPELKRVLIAGRKELGDEIFNSYYHSARSSLGHQVPKLKII